MVYIIVQNALKHHSRFTAFARLLQQGRPFLPGGSSANPPASSTDAEISLESCAAGQTGPSARYVCNRFMCDLTHQRTCHQSFYDRTIAGGPGAPGGPLKSKGPRTVEDASWSVRGPHPYSPKNGLRFYQSAGRASLAWGSCHTSQARHRVGYGLWSGAGVPVTRTVTISWG